MINLTEIILSVIGTGILTTIVTHILTKKKFTVEIDQLKAQIKQIKTQTDGDSISNMDKSLDFYEKLANATNKRLDDVLARQDIIIDENKSLKNQVVEVNTRMAKLASVICTNLTCVHREIDEGVVECIYPKTEKEIRKLAKKSKKV